MRLEDLKVLFEDNHLIAVNKPAGILTQPDETGDECLADLVKAYIRLRYDKPGDAFLGTVHRIDRPVSGVVIFARTSKATVRMNELFASRAMTKVYWAIVQPRPLLEEATLEHYLLKDPAKNITKAYDQPSRRNEGSKLSSLSYSILSDIGKHCLLEVVPTTGRSHQIRAQLAKIGCPIKGDVKYGAVEPLRDASICLHARRLSFMHPVKQEPVVIEAALPRTQAWQIFHNVEQ